MEHCPSLNQRSQKWLINHQICSINQNTLSYENRLSVNNLRLHPNQCHCSVSACGWDSPALTAKLLCNFHAICVFACVRLLLLLFFPCTVALWLSLLLLLLMFLSCFYCIVLPYTMTDVLNLFLDFRKTALHLAREYRWKLASWLILAQLQ